MESFIDKIADFIQTAAQKKGLCSDQGPVVFLFSSFCGIGCVCLHRDMGEGRRLEARRAKPWPVCESPILLSN